MSFRLFSNDLIDGGVLPVKQVYHGFGHTGGNYSPQMAWEGAPEGTKSFVLTMYDPDAPTGSGFWHWIVADVPGSEHQLAEGVGSGETSLPAGARHIRNDFGALGYVGAAPPPGPAHRYLFTLQALSVDKLPVQDDASGAMVGLMAGMHVLAKAKLTVTFGV